MKTFFVTAAGVALGTLIYTGLLGSTHEPDWYRVLFLAVFSGVCSLVWPGTKKAPAESDPNGPGG